MCGLHVCGLEGSGLGCLVWFGGVYDCGLKTVP